MVAFLMVKVNAGKYTIHGSYGNESLIAAVEVKTTPSLPKHSTDESVSFLSFFFFLSSFSSFSSSPNNRSKPVMKTKCHLCEFSMQKNTSEPHQKWVGHAGPYKPRFWYKNVQKDLLCVIPCFQVYTLED